MTDTTSAAAIKPSATENIINNDDKISTTTTTSSSSPPSSSFWFQRLITKEDTFHIHKIFGLFWIITVALRCYLGSDTDMGFESHPQYTIWTIFIHLGLSISSFQFAIPKRRILTGDRIWPEARIHATVFACRSLAIIYLITYERYYNLPPNYNWNLIIVLCSMAAADFGSWSVGETYRSQSIRDLSIISPRTKFIFSAMQLLATNNCLFGFRRCSIHYTKVLVIQGNAFSMTLRRKNIIKGNGTTLIYAAMLHIGPIIAVYDLMQNGGGWQVWQASLVTGLASILLRLGPRRIIPGLDIIQNNKYILWICIGLVLHQYQSWLISDDAKQFTMVMSIVQFIAIVALAASKSDEIISNNKDDDNSNKVDKQETLKKPISDKSSSAAGVKDKKTD